MAQRGDKKVLIEKLGRDTLLTATQIAKKVKTSPAYVHQVLRGIERPSESDLSDGSDEVQSADTSDTSRLGISEMVIRCRSRKLGSIPGSIIEALEDSGLEFSFQCSRLLHEE